MSLLDVGYYLCFVLGRTFLLGLINLLFPFLLAFSALDMFKEYVSRGFKMYFATVILLYVIHLSFGIGNEIYKALLKGFGADGDGGSLSRFFGKVVVGMIAIIIKLTFSKKGTQFIFRLLS